MPSICFSTSPSKRSERPTINPAGRPDGRRHVLRLSSSPSSSTACNNIDRLIDRTLIYWTLTAALGLVYADAVLVLGDVFMG
jgi:hypothetical protein